MESNNSNLRPVWDALLDIYQPLSQVLDELGLRHFVCGGTALGAVRHKGFIPWDDDFDIFMPRPDYEALKCVAEAKLPSHLRFISAHNTPSYPHPFGKVIETRQSVVDKVSSDSKFSLPQGLFVDIFPLDGIPSNKFALFFWLAKRALWRRVMGNTQQSRLRYERWISSLPFDSSKRVEDAKESGARLLKYGGWDSNLFQQKKMLKFDKIKVPLPTPPERFLVNMFGPNFMQLPPEDQRKPSHQVMS